MKAYLLTLSVSFTLLACGGGSSSTAPNNTNAVTQTSEISPETQTEKTLTESQTAAVSSEIKADENFTFETEYVIKLSADKYKNQQGAVHVYQQREAIDGVLAPNPLTRITTFYPIIAASIEIKVNPAWGEVIVHWVPTSASEFEKVQAITLNSQEVEFQIN